MSVFDLEKIKEELSVYDPLMPCVMKALRVIGRLCEEGQKLEKQRDLLASKLGYMCSVSNRDSCGVPEPCPYSKGHCRCLDVEQEEWVQVAKEAGK